jgi:hypothetical protein
VIGYHTTTEIWLSLESYYNRGMTPKWAGEVIERVHDHPGRYLTCEPSGFNGNWIVRTMWTNPEDVRQVVRDIERALDLELFGANQQKRGGEQRETVS